MIDLETERLISLREVPKFLPLRSNGKRLHISGVYRWVNVGVRGVVLESATIGGATYTSREALQRFVDQLSAKSPSSSQPHRRVSAPGRRAERADRARIALEQELGLQVWPQRGVLRSVE